jgi:UDP-N-acetylmuramyl pentapeptide phosphotransferase/UDP-N-acetylglucosamine-1-phosphate transferase
MSPARWPEIAWIALAFFVSLAATRLVLSVARRRLIDRPGDRSSHAVPTPRGGGLGALAALLLALIASALARGRPSGALLALCAVVALVLGGVGLLDDARGLSRGFRYAAHLTVAAAAVAWFGPVAPAWLGPAAVPIGAAVTLVGFTALVNFYNFMDGMDGLVAGCAVVQFGFVGAWTGELAWLLVAAAFAGLLFWNLPPARIFMGDVGSTALGGLAGAAVVAHWHALPSHRWLVALPLVGDALYTIARRLARRENVLVAHHSHVYQRLLRSGWSHGRISALYVALTAACGSLTVLERPGALLAVALCVSALVAAEARCAWLGVPFTR